MKKKTTFVLKLVNTNINFNLFYDNCWWLTRLTDSGLSITEWLFKGILPPFNEKTWNEYFDLYKEIPQFKLINPNMSLEEFKIIFYWEYFHRILGRIIGLVFLFLLFIFL